MATVERSLGRRVAAFRESAGLTQVDLAGRIGADAMAISRLERGVTTPSVRRLASIADVLGVTLRDLFDFEAPAERGAADAQIAGIVAALRGRPVAEVKRVAAVVRAMLKKE